MSTNKKQPPAKINPAQERHKLFQDLQKKHAEEELDLRIKTATKEELGRMEESINKQLDSTAQLLRGKLLKIQARKKELK